MELVFWSALFLVFYTYLGYGILQYAISKFRIREKSTRIEDDNTYTPQVAFIIAAYNEEDCLEQKIINTLALDYPESKLQVVVITDGSTDRSMHIAASYPNVQLFHKPERKGKLHAIHRVYPNIEADVLVFSDANTYVNKSAVKEIVKHFRNEQVGVVSGEKRVHDATNQTASKGEGIYWKYESFLKKLDSDLGSAMGAAGELFAVRYSCMQHIPEDTIIEDFYLSMKIVSQGKKIVYEPNAYAIEGGSANTTEEVKRKVRISAGGLQAVYRLSTLLNPFKYGWISVQFFSHRVLRWVLCPILLPVLMFSNTYLLFASNWLGYYILFDLQLLFYLLVMHGHYLSMKNKSAKVSIIPYYFWLMNYCVFLGMSRLLRNKQTVLWEKAKRV